MKYTLIVFHESFSTIGVIWTQEDWKLDVIKPKSLIEFNVPILLPVTSSLAIVNDLLTGNVNVKNETDKSRGDLARHCV